MRGSRRLPGGSTSCPGDVNDDGVVNAQDLVLVRNDFTASARAYNVFDDINGDGVVDINDTNLVGRFIGKKLPGDPHLTPPGGSPRAPRSAGEADPRRTVFIRTRTPERGDDHGDSRSDPR